MATLAFGLAVHFLTPMIAELFYEAYHLFLWEPLYTAYGAARYLSSQFMFWPGRWMVSVGLTLLFGLAVIFRARRVGGDLDG